jgi:signal transduction histidine kinase
MYAQPELATAHITHSNIPLRVMVTRHSIGRTSADGRFGAGLAARVMENFPLQHGKNPHGQGEEACAAAENGGMAVAETSTIALADDVVVMIPSRRQMRFNLTAIVAAMILAMGIVGALAWWDAERDAETALEEFGDAQAVVARSAAADLNARLSAVLRDARLIAEAGSVPPSVAERYAIARILEADTPPDLFFRGFNFLIPVSNGRRIHLAITPAQLFAGLERIEHPGSLALFISSPTETGIRSVDGRIINDAQLKRAMEGMPPTLQLERPHAAALGLPERLAVAGLAHFDEETLGRWGVAAVASAFRERDRERRDRWRLVLSVVLAGALVLSFGGVALWHQRKELNLARDLEVAQLSRERDERLERLGKMATLVTLASGVAHEVSTPLGVIVGRAEQLSPRVKDDERATKAVQVILEQSERISQVVRGFLTLARDGSPTLGRVSPVSIVQGALALVQHRFEKAGVNLDGGAVPSALPAIAGDARLLEHALVNLLLNACDATPREGHVQVSARTEGQSLAIDVTDDGVGITEADAARATEPFFTTKPPGQGTGLGLAIANEIVKSHRGSLSIQSAGAKGTRASLRIPLA